MSELALKLIREAKESRATRLDLGNCGLTELPEALFELTWLEELFLSSESGYCDFGKKQWINLESLNKNEENNIKYISPKINQLKNLKIFSACSWKKQWDLSDLS